jgi:hypothetical protein
MRVVRSQPWRSPLTESKAQNWTTIYQRLLVALHWLPLWKRRKYETTVYLRLQFSLTSTSFSSYTVRIASTIPSGMDIVLDGTTAKIGTFAVPSRLPKMVIACAVS